MTKRQARRGGIVVLILAVLGGIGAAGWRLAPSSSSEHAQSATAKPVSSSAPPSVTFTPADGATDVALSQRVQLQVERAHIVSAQLLAPNGVAVPGVTVADGSLWYAGLTSLQPSTRYEIHARVADDKGRERDATASFTTLSPGTGLSWTMTPGDNDVVGIGMPVIIKFRQPVADKAAVERRLQVQTSKPVVGAWHWFSDTEVRFRPLGYWPANTDVGVIADLTGVDAGNGVWGTDVHSIHFRIGDAHVSTADANSHTLTVTDNGRVVGVYPASLGREKYPTMSGVHIVLNKQQSVVMDSATNGIPRNSPDGYFETVFWDVAISDHGEYVHAAPWSVSDQGHTNVSHGCVNLSVPNATSFFMFSQRGDVVNVVGTGRPPDTSDTAMKDWNMPWSQWVAGSALARAPGPDPSTLIR
ncbi:MAG TPA: Ig-like domain-containing protein [Acidimicrobiia bacterium]|nr:Ig-like domain-containing protein [Acidimicrobiia bacterium]